MRVLRLSSFSGKGAAQFPVETPCMASVRDRHPFKIKERDVFRRETDALRRETSAIPREKKTPCIAKKRDAMHGVSTDLFLRIEQKDHVIDRLDNSFRGPKIVRQ
ncbi:MAG: hypothetical protein ABIU63_16955 [Chitinophagaceae bacterium]